MNGNTPQIVQYQGSKRILAPQILQYMPRHFSRLVEPFSGMAAISIAVARLKRADTFLINDINAPIVEILRSAIETPGRLLQDYSEIWSGQFDYPEGSVAHFYHVRDEFNHGQRDAARMLYLIARCVKGSVRYSAEGEFNQSPDKRRNGTSPKSLKENITAISYYLKGKTEFMSDDYREVLTATRQGDLVYMDPPYQGVTNVRDSRYLAGVDFEEFVDAVDTLNQRGIDFLISYDGVCGDKKYGQDLPDFLNLRKVMLKAGLSSQALLLGDKKTTYEALYISHGLSKYMPEAINQPNLFEPQMAV